MRGILFLAAFLLILLSGCNSKSKKIESTSATELSQPGQQETNYQHLDSIIPELLKTYDTPSITVSLIEDAKITWSGVYGQQSPDKGADEKTLYLCASITKPLTAEVFLRLVEAGEVSLDEPMYAYYVDPDIAQDARAKLLTPRHVLTHQTGFKNWRRMSGGVLKFENDPGTKMGYSGEGFLYLARFVEHKLRRPFNDIAKEVLFEPLGMENSALAQQDWYDGRPAWPKFPDGSWNQPKVRKEAQGAGGLHTTSTDYALFLIAIMKGEGITSELRKEQFTISLNQHEYCLSKETNKAACPPELGFGLGWYVYDFEDERIIGHTGANLGERTLAVFSPTKKSGFVAMTNGANGNYVIFELAKFFGVHEGFIEIEKPEKTFR